MTTAIAIQSVPIDDSMIGHRKNEARKFYDIHFLPVKFIVRLRFGVCGNCCYFSLLKKHDGL